jgi:hypothetical protein
LPFLYIYIGHHVSDFSFRVVCSTIVVYFQTSSIFLSITMISISSVITPLEKLCSLFERSPNPTTRVLVDQAFIYYDGTLMTAGHLYRDMLSVVLEKSQIQLASRMANNVYPSSIMSEARYLSSIRIMSSSVGLAKDLPCNACIIAEQCLTWWIYWTLQLASVPI